MKSAGEWIWHISPSIQYYFPVSSVFIRLLRQYGILNKFLASVNHDMRNPHIFVIISSLTYLLTPWSRVLLEKLTGSAASQEIPHFFGTRRFITVLTSARHLSLSWANSIQSPQPSPTSWRSILILSSHLRLGLPNGLFSSGFPTRTLCTLWKSQGLKPLWLPLDS